MENILVSDNKKVSNYYNRYVSCSKVSCQQWSKFINTTWLSSLVSANSYPSAEDYNNNKKYLNLSDENRLREWRLPPVRGDFKDYFGKTIAGNVEIFQLHVVPEEVTNFKVLMFRLRKILNLSDNEYRKIIKIFYQALD